MNKCYTTIAGWVDSRCKRILPQRRPGAPCLALGAGSPYPNTVTAVAAFQHLETLNDAVNRSANTIIRETVPDNFLKRADEVMNIDITVDELRTRLRAGKIYAAEKVEQSLANFFRKGNLNMLRELALRTTAEQVSSRASEYRRTQGLEQAPIPEKVMVCLSTRPGTERLLRIGARVAGRLATNWYACLLYTSRCV